MSTQPEKAEPEKTSRPEKVFRNGTVSASIFINEVSSVNGSFKIPKVIVQKRYKDKDGEWQSTSSFDLNELPKLALAANKAYDHLTNKEVP